MFAQIVQAKANVAADIEHIKFILNKGNLLTAFLKTLEAY